MNVLTVSDLHMPFHHRDSFDFLRDLAKEVKPDHVVCLGDEIDAYSWSRYARDPDALSARQEMRLARKGVAVLAKLFPTMTVVESNHTVRPIKRAAEAGIPGSFLKSIRELIEAPRTWRWVPTYSLHGVRYLHGDGFSGRDAAFKASQSYRTSVAMGHVHAFAGVVWHAGQGGRNWAMNCGCLINPKAMVFDYGKHLAHRPVLGTGIVLDGTPHFMPLE